MRLQRYLAQAGIASRRRAEEMIVEGRVRVNGVIVRELGTRVATGDRVAVDDRPVAPAAARSYLVLNKPIGVVTTLHDPEGRSTVADLLRRRKISERLFPVGRLDYDTAGVLMLTDDGDLAHVLMHPKHGVEKTYRAVVSGRFDPDSVAAVAGGVRLDDGRTSPARVRIVAASRTASTVDITIHEGKNRQVRRTFEALGHPVLGLTRMRFGPITLGSLGPGEFRSCSERELHALRALTVTPS